MHLRESTKKILSYVMHKNIINLPVGKLRNIDENIKRWAYFNFNSAELRNVDKHVKICMNWI